MKFIARLRSVPVATVVSAGALALIVGGFLVLKAYSLLPHASDEGIYFYGAARVADGLVPYRDFFFAHPPLHLLVPALLFKVAGGYHLWLAKAVPFLAAALQGVCVWLCVRRLAAGDRPSAAGEVGAVAAAAGLLFSESVLKASGYATGINQTAGLLALAATLLVYRRPTVAGCVAGAAVTTLIQGAPVAAVLAVASLALGRRAMLRFVIGAAAVVLVVHAAFLALAGKAFIEQVYLFHLAKVDRPGEGARQLGFILVDNWTLFAGGALGAAALLLAQRRRLAAVAIAAAVLQLVAMATRPRVFPFYFQPAFFAVALLLGCGVALVVAGLRRAPGAPMDRIHAGGLLGLAVLLLTVFEWPMADALSPRRAEQRATYAQSYTWVDAPGIGPMNHVVRALFWQDGERRVGHDYNPVTQYLWQRSRWLDSQPTIVEAVKLLAGQRSGATLFGDSSTAPLVALTAGLPITGDLVDTNIERFRSGVLPFATVETLLDRSPAALLLLGEREGIASLPEMQAYVDGRYRVLARFESKTGARHAIYGRK